MVNQLLPTGSLEHQCQYRGREKMNMKESLYAVMLASANETCNGVADHIAGSIDAFVGKMNEKAQSLGCKNTHFANTNGLWKKRIIILRHMIWHLLGGRRSRTRISKK